jgi:hypothetical protein
MTKKALFKRSGAPDLEQLQNEAEYSQILELNFDDMIPFVLSNIRKKGWMSWLFIAINIAALTGIGIYSIWGIRSGWITWSGFVIQFLLGVFAGSLLIIPFHELLHGLAYKLLGARKIQFGANLKQFFFYVSADKFPVNRRELLFLAMLPFIVVNAALLLAAIFWIPQYTVSCAFLLLSHNLMCIGDFAISNYATIEKGEVISYDEAEKRKCYFYKRLDSDL